MSHPSDPNSSQAPRRDPSDCHAAVEPAADQNLVIFLQQHRPPVPAAAAGLEDRVIQSLASLRSRRPRRAWAAAALSIPAIAASLLLLVRSGNAPAEPQLSEAELVSLGSFLDPPSASDNSSASAQDLIPLMVDPAELPDRAR
jgi:hypothetical protein